MFDGSTGQLTKGSLRTVSNQCQRVSRYLKTSASAPPCAKSESIRFHNVYLHLVKPNSLQTLGKRVGIDQHHGVKEVEQTERTTVKAICARKNSTGTQNTSDFGE